MTGTLVIGSKSRRRRRGIGSATRIEKVSKPGRSMMWTLVVLAVAGFMLVGVTRWLINVGPQARAERAGIVARVEQETVRIEMMHRAADLTSRCGEARVAARPMLEDGRIDSAELGELRAIAFGKCGID